MSSATPEATAPDIPWLIVVTGYPATGKTTLARHLARELRVPMIAKDAIKERLFDVMGTGDLEWSHLLGRASMAVLYEQIGAILDVGRSVIAEANFDADLGGRDLRRVLAERPARCIRVVLLAEPEALLTRCRERSASGERHPGHIDQWLIDELEQLVKLPYEPPDLPGPRLDLEVSDLDAVDFDAVTARVRAEMGRPSEEHR